MKQQVLFVSELASPTVVIDARRCRVLKPRRAPKRHLDATPAFGDKGRGPRALCFECCRGSLGWAGAHDKHRLVSVLHRVSCKWCLALLREHAQLQSFYLGEKP